MIELIDNAKNIVGYVAELQGVNIVLVYDEECGLFNSIYGDERRYLQILINFLSNAIKFSKKNSQVVIDLHINET